MIEREYQEAFSPRWVIDNIEERTHELVLLRQIIPWQNLLEELSGFYSRDKGRKGISLRIMVALLLIKHLRHLSDRQVVQQVKENRYIQYFCNVPDENLSTFINRTSPLSRFRQRVGVEGVAHIEGIIFEILKKTGVISDRNCLMDSTVLAANIIYPTDVNLLYKAIQKMSHIAEKFHLSLELDQVALKKSWRNFGRDKKTPLGEYISEFFGFFEKTLKSFRKICGHLGRAHNLLPLLSY